jgi:predicted DCC family thiol-disulfide oxidoreductase YuxK
MAIVFFDGHCNLCNRFIDFLITRDHARRLKFAPLQGRTAAAELGPEFNPTAPDTVVLKSAGKVYIRSTAAILTLAELRGIYVLAKIFLFIPRFIRDWAYRVIATNRYSWFGRRDTCRLPSEAEKAQFLE